CSRRWPFCRPRTRRRACDRLRRSEVWQLDEGLPRPCTREGSFSSRPPAPLKASPPPIQSQVLSQLSSSALLPTLTISVFVRRPSAPVLAVAAACRSLRLVFAPVFAYQYARCDGSGAMEAEVDRVSAGELRSGKGHKDENFPVASLLVAAKYRAPILAFYRFARVADDVADHPDLPPPQKLALLDSLEASLLGASRSEAEGVALRT